jgi:esterase/lipase superfamily enzyme
MPTPRLYLDGAADPFASVPAPLRTADVELIYVTDRARDGERYGAGRSRSAAYGTCAARIGDGLSWESLVALSRSAEREVPVGLSIVDIRERGRWPETPYPLRVRDGRVELDPSVVDARERAMKDFQELLRSRLRTSPRKEVLIFVHGYNNEFEYPAMVLGQVAHFLGREFVPILYSWPAGSGGLLRGYTADRESGEFTVYHLKELLKTLAACEELKGAHFLAHSRGTDIATTALREMLLESGKRVNERDPKLKTLILAAPDLDAQVITQRLGAEGLVYAPGRTVLYTSSSDGALGLAAWLFRSVARLGAVRTEDLDPAVVEQLRRYPKLQVVDAQVTGYGSGHDYFFAHPAVSSDLILLLREGLDPGPRRPLTLNSRACWTLDDDYPGSGQQLR